MTLAWSLACFDHDGFSDRSFLKQILKASCTFATIASLVFLATAPSLSSAAILSNQERLDRILSNQTPENTVDPKDVLEHGIAPHGFPYANAEENNSDQIYASNGDTDSSDEIISGSHLSSLTSLVPNVWADYYSIPWEMLNPHDLSNLGLSRFTDSGRFFDIKSLGPSFALTIPIDDTGLFIPANTSLLFIFNTSRVAEETLKNMEEMISNTNEDPETSEKFVDDGLKSSSDKKRAPDAITQAALPFGLPQYHYVQQYSLLVPKRLIKLDHNVVPVLSGDAWVRKIGLRGGAIPLSKDMLQTDGPVLVFVFKSGETLADFVEDGSPEYASVAKLLDMEEKIEQEYKFNVIGHVTETEQTILARKQYHHAKSRITNALMKTSSEIAKAVLSSSSTFFDNFAKRWASTVGVESLQYSTFCQANFLFHEQSYCLKFEKDGNAVVSLITAPSNTFNLDYSVPSQLRKRDLSSIKEYVKSKEHDMLEKMVGTSLKLDSFMSVVGEYASALGEKSEDSYFSLKWHLLNKFGILYKNILTSFI